jgi:hypothetical protein
MRKTLRELEAQLQVLEVNSLNDLVNLTLDDGRHIQLKFTDPLIPLDAAVHNEEPYFKKYVMQAVDTGADGENMIILAQAIWKSHARIEAEKAENQGIEC